VQRIESMFSLYLAPLPPKLMRITCPLGLNTPSLYWSATSVDDIALFQTLTSSMLPVKYPFS
jgi:hypothetical protein